MSLSVNTNKPINTPKLIATAATGAAIGAGASYLLQKQAINVANARKAALEAEANKKGLAKLASKIKKGAIWFAGKVKDSAKAAKTKITNSLAEIGKNGKISKMGIAKTALAAAVLLPAAIWVKNKLFTSKKES